MDIVDMRMRLEVAEKVKEEAIMVAETLEERLALALHERNKAKAETAKWMEMYDKLARERDKLEVRWRRNLRRWRAASKALRTKQLEGERRKVADLWFSSDPGVWKSARQQYWTIVDERPTRDLEHALDALDLERIRRMDAQAWYEFLRDEYFPWKYTNRRWNNSKHLRYYIDQNALAELDQVRQRLLCLDTDDIHSALETASEIRGLGTAGASGLLALMYPASFGTVDQFVVKALREVPGLPDALALANMNPESLTIQEGVLIVELLRRKAAEINRAINAPVWTPRRVDMALWACRQPPPFPSPPSLPSYAGPEIAVDRAIRKAFEEPRQERTFEELRQEERQKKP